MLHEAIPFRDACDRQITMSSYCKVVLGVRRPRTCGRGKGERSRADPRLPDQVKVALEMLGLGPFAHADGKPSCGQVVVQTMIVHHPAHRRQKLGIGAISQSAAAQEAGLIKGASVFMDDDRRAHRERLEHDVAERLGKERGHHDRAGAAEEPGERRDRPATPRSARSASRAASDLSSPSYGPVPAIRKSTSGR